MIRANRLGSGGVQCQSYGQLRDTYLWLPAATDPELRLVLRGFRDAMYSDNALRTAESTVFRCLRVPKSLDWELRAANTLAVSQNLGTRNFGRHKTNDLRWFLVPDFWDTELGNASPLMCTRGAVSQNFGTWNSRPSACLRV